MYNVVVKRSNSLGIDERRDANARALERTLTGAGVFDDINERIDSERS